MVGHVGGQGHQQGFWTHGGRANETPPGRASDVAELNERWSLPHGGADQFSAGTDTSNVCMA